MVKHSKKKSRRRRGWIAITLQLIGVGLLGILVAVVLFPAVHAALKPFRLDGDQAQRLDRLSERHARLSARLAERRRYRDHLRTPEGREVLARQQGFHLPGEKVYLLRRDDVSTR